MKPLLSLYGLTKRYPCIVANDSISLDLFPGEIHSILGENGAGKSTLVKMLCGITAPDEGEMVFDGEAYHPSSPQDARVRGVSVIFQHFSLFEALTVRDNIALCLPVHLRRNLDALLAKVSDSYGLPLDPKRLVGNLSAGERQRVEVVRSLLQEPRLLIMDEPTSVLTPQEVEGLFVTLRDLASRGCSILYISHKLDEIRALCTKVTVLRSGRVSGSCDPRTETSRSLAEMMIGKELKSPKARQVSTGEMKLQVSNLTVKNQDRFGVDLRNISFRVHAGEILGIAGVAGNGQEELMRALIGEVPVARNGCIVIDGTDVGAMSPNKRRSLGMCFAPEKRLGHSAAPDMALWENAVLSARERLNLSEWGFISIQGSKAYAQKVVEHFGVKTRGVEQSAKSHSGGNLQKFVIGREIMQRPAVLVVSQPTWGVDAGAAAVIHQALLDLAAEGAAIVVISQDLDELMSISSNFAVLANGTLSPTQATQSVTVEAVGVLMGGHEYEGAVNA